MTTSVTAVRLSPAAEANQAASFLVRTTRKGSQPPEASSAARN